MVAIDEFGGAFEKPSRISVHAFDGKSMNEMADFGSIAEQKGQLSTRERTLR